MSTATENPNFGLYATRNEQLINDHRMRRAISQRPFLVQNSSTPIFFPTSLYRTRETKMKLANVPFFACVQSILKNLNMKLSFIFLWVLPLFSFALLEAEDRPSPPRDLSEQTSTDTLLQAKQEDIQKERNLQFGRGDTGYGRGDGYYDRGCKNDNY